jgi:alkylated DNA repair protein (DNA oxidative demethylase)
MQSRPEVVPLRQGDAVAFCSASSPVPGRRGIYGVNMRHGVSRLRSGHRHTLGIIFTTRSNNKREDSAVTLSLFNEENAEPRTENLAPGAYILRGFALRDEAAHIDALGEVVAKAPFRHMTTPGGYRMSVAMTNCGSLGWITDQTSYRYTSIDPESGQKWPPMPASFLALANDAAAEAGCPNFIPDACLINRYQTGARLSLHQDKDEKDFSAPIVSVSLGVPAVFLFGGLNRADKTKRVPVVHGDVIVWGGPARLRYHGVLALKKSNHRLLGEYRINLTFRKAG